MITKQSGGIHSPPIRGGTGEKEANATIDEHDTGDLGYGIYPTVVTFGWSISPAANSELAGVEYD
jgi:hypothetical protein